LNQEEILAKISAQAGPAAAEKYARDAGWVPPEDPLSNKHDIIRKILQTGGPDAAEKYMKDAEWDPADLGMHISPPPTGTDRAEYRAMAEEKLGAPVDWTGGLRPTERFFGAMSEMPEEEDKLVEWSTRNKGVTKRVKENPDDQYDLGKLYHQYEGTDKFVPYNKKGADWGDLAGAGPEIIKAVPAALSALHPWGRAAGTAGQVFKEATKAGVTYAGMQGLEEAAEVAMDTQEQGPLGVGATVLGGGLTEFAGAGVGGKLYQSLMRLSRGPTGKLPDVLKQELTDVQAGLHLDPDASMIPGHMVSGGSEYRTAAERLYKNIDSMSGMLSADQRMIARKIAMEEITPQGDITPRGLELISEFDIGVQNELVRMRPQTTMLEGGQAIKQGTIDYTGARREAAGQKYRDIETFVAEENPVFDFTGAKMLAASPGRTTAEETVQIPSSIVDANGNAVLDDVVQFLEVDPSPGAVYERVSSLVQRMDTFQNQYQVANTLQSQLGKHLEDVKDSFGNLPEGMGPVIRLRSTLLDTLENPVNKVDTPKYAAGIVDARASWRKMAEETQTKELYRHLKETDPMTLIDDMVGGRGMPPEMYQTLRYMEQMRPNLAATYKEGFQARLLGAYGPDNVKQVQTLKGSNPEMYDFMGGDTLLRDAREVDRLWKTPGGQMVLNGSSPADGFRGVIPGIKSPEQARQTLELAGGRGSEGHRLLQIAAVEDVTRASKSAIDNESGARLFNSKAMDRKIADLIDTGVWDTILTAGQRTRLKGMAARTRIMSRQLGSDTGAALEVQKVVSDAKHPNTMLTALAKIEWNHILAGVVLQKDGLKKLDRLLSLKTPVTTKYAVAFSGLVAPVYGSFSEGEVSDAARKLYDNGIEWAKNGLPAEAKEMWQGATRGTSP